MSSSDLKASHQAASDRIITKRDTGEALLNLGSGAHPHPDFINIDIHSAAGVIGHDVRTGLPFPDETFDFVYHATMLSVLKPAEASRLMSECRRVLKPGGVPRVVTGDLEQACRVYLEKVEAAWNGDVQSGFDHEWMVLELYDQATREQYGGRMSEYVMNDPVPNPDFIVQRVGIQGQRMLDRAKALKLERPSSSAPAKSSAQFSLSSLRKWVAAAILGEDGMKARELGRFRMYSGQVTHRMHDRYSLSRLFAKAGFKSVTLRTIEESGLGSWKSVNLDVLDTGDVARPHCFIMEGTR